MDGLNAAEQRELETRLQKRQVKEFMNIFGGMIDNCFSSCINDFTSKSLSGAETGCLNRCVLKTMATNTRLGERFAELTAVMNNQMQQQ